MSATKLRQVELFDMQTNSHLFCWLPIDGRIRRGTRLTLKEFPKRQWTVVKVFQTEIEAAHLNQQWHVGGL